MSASKTKELARRFVQLAVRYQDWREVSSLSDEEAQVLFEVVRAGGFEAKEVTLGKLRGNFLEQDGSPTGDTYAINHLCPFKVVAESGNDHYLATGWLDSMLRCAVVANEGGRTRTDVLDRVEREILNSIPLSPIQLNAEGDYLEEYPPSASYLTSAYFLTHRRDADELGYCAGVHKHCNGYVDRNKATETHDALSCRKCHMRILFPKEVKTYGQLRRALQQKAA